MTKELRPGDAPPLVLDDFSICRDAGRMWPNCRVISLGHSIEVACADPNGRFEVDPRACTVTKRLIIGLG